MDHYVQMEKGFTSNFAGSSWAAVGSRAPTNCTLGGSGLGHSIAKSMLYRNIVEPCDTCMPGERSQPCLWLALEQQVRMRLVHAAAMLSAGALAVMGILTAPEYGMSCSRLGISFPIGPEILGLNYREKDSQMC